MATEAARRRNEAQNAVTSAEARRKQVETDTNQLQKEVDDARKFQDKLNTDAATLRQQIQTLKDELAASQSQSSELKARQDAVQQEEQKLTKLQQQVTSAETRLNELNVQEEKQRRESEGLTNRLEQIHKEVTDEELRRDTAKADFQKADSDLDDDNGERTTTEPRDFARLALGRCTFECDTGFCPVSASGSMLGNSHE
jgi:chromosome segregation ATPase